MSIVNVFNFSYVLGKFALNTFMAYLCLVVKIVKRAQNRIII